MPISSNSHFAERCLILRTFNLLSSGFCSRLDLLTSKFGSGLQLLLAGGVVPGYNMLSCGLWVCREAEDVNMARFADHLANSYIPNTVIIDATASEVPPALYLQWMQKGIHIITPNKKLGSGPLDQYLALRLFQRESYIHFFYEASHNLPLQS